MLTFLHGLPDVAILALLAACFMALLLAAPMLARATGLPPHANRAEAAFDAYKTITSILGVVLAFSLVQVNTNLRNAEAMVGREASAIIDLDRALLRFGTPDTASLRPVLAAYGQAIIHDEWPVLATGGRSAMADRLYRTMNHAIRPLEPATPGQVALFNLMLKDVDDLADLREARINTADLALPAIFWDTVLTLSALMVLLAGLADREASRSLTISMNGAAIALLLALVIVVDGPFAGQSSVSPAPIQKALALDLQRN